MGFLRLFKKDVEPARLHNLKNHLFASFSSFKQDLDHQNKWVNYLHKAVLEIKNNNDSNKYNTHAHIEKIHSNVGNIHQWIDHLHSASAKQTDRIKAIERNLKQTLELYNKHIMDLFKLVHSKDESNTKEVRKNLKNELLLELQLHMVEHKNYVKNSIGQVHSQLEEHSKKHVEHVKQLKGVDELHNGFKELQERLHKAAISHKVTPKKSQLIKGVQPTLPRPAVERPVEVVYKHALLTNPEQKLLNILFSESDPISYAHLSNKTGHSINTIRVNMNFLKKKGLIEENLLPTGVKLFNLKNKERIKKMYNVQHI